MSELPVYSKDARTTESSELWSLIKRRQDERFERFKSSCLRHTERMQRLQTKTFNTEDRNQVSSDESELLDAIHRARSEADALTQQKKEQESKLAAATAQLDAMLLEREEADKENVDARDTKRFHESLLRTTTGVQFDDEAPAGTTRGFIALGGEMKAFSFDETKNSNFFVTNSLWEIVYSLNGK
ncbi:uncharacterized protein LOC134194706 [Corticium candelabrum]|uniref:uncharacterized protein LOC134194706 n=1 Tax=Corticium candelabrum TaxID=121492 RepID=UPI002E256BE9|nr:uncharacterized protein LOC134194706 [Corticium candelabrum]